MQRHTLHDVQGYVAHDAPHLGPPEGPGLSGRIGGAVYSERVKILPRTGVPRFEDAHPPITPLGP
jgi:hypothetical protein